VNFSAGSAANRMTPDRYQQLIELFEAASKQAPGEQWAFLQRSCRDEELRREAEAMLAADREAGGLLDQAFPNLAAAFPKQRSRLWTGQRLGDYRVLHRLGEGGMSEVYLAEDIRLQRKAVLKLLPDSFSLHPDSLRRFEREARAVSSLNHPNIITIYQIGHENAAHFLATEFVDGPTLRDIISNGPIDLPTFLDIALQIARALEAAHTAGVVHRDIKPENIMLRRDGLVKVVDFGVAKLLQLPNRGSAEHSDSFKTAVGTIIGTPRYMSPEQAMGLEVGPLTDVFSFGAVMYEMLTGRAVFEGPTIADEIAAVINKDPPPIQLQQAVPLHVTRIIERTLHKDAAHRLPSMREVVADLRSAKQNIQHGDSRLRRLSKTVHSLFRIRYD